MIRWDIKETGHRVLFVFPLPPSLADAQTPRFRSSRLCSSCHMPSTATTDTILNLSHVTPQLVSFLSLVLRQNPLNIQLEILSSWLYMTRTISNYYKMCFINPIITIHVVLGTSKTFMGARTLFWDSVCGSPFAGSPRDSVCARDGVRVQTSV